MIQEFSTDDLTDKELLKKCIMSLSDTILQGKIAEQDVIDIGAIGLALLLRKMPE